MMWALTMPPVERWQPRHCLALTSMTAMVMLKTDMTRDVRPRGWAADRERRQTSVCQGLQPLWRSYSADLFPYGMPGSASRRKLTNDSVVNGTSSDNGSPVPLTGAWGVSTQAPLFELD